MHPLSEYMLWLFYLENMVTEHSTFGCDGLSLQPAAVVTSSVIKASLLCSRWLWSSVCQKQGDRRGSECFQR